MRIAALVFGLLGVVGSGALGFKWIGDIRKQKDDIALVRTLGEASGDPAVKEKLADYDRMVWAAYALLGCAVLGAAGCWLVFVRKGVIAGGVFLVAFAAPLALAGDGRLAIFTFGLALAALLSFFVRPAPALSLGADED